MSSSPNKKKAKAAPAEEKGETAPLWIISFADMISLLMAFFVMMLTMAHTKSGHLLNPGEGIFEKTILGFKSSISGFGLPGMFGKASEPSSFEYGKGHYNLAGDSNDADGRLIDAREEKVRRLFTELQRSTKTSYRQEKTGSPTFVATPIVFQQGQADLDDSAKQFLTQFTLNLKESPKRPLGLYIIGLAHEELAESQKWILSIRRAQAAGDFLKELLTSEQPIPVYCWGAASDSRLIAGDKLGSNQPQILITVLYAND